jgi:hypothetical protein
MMMMMMMMVLDDEDKGQNRETQISLSLPKKTRKRNIFLKKRSFFSHSFTIAS